MDYTSWVFDRRRLRAVEKDPFEILQNDCTCWAISRAVLEKIPPSDLAVNRYDWGIDFLVIAAARARRLTVLHDFRSKVWREDSCKGGSVRFVKK